MKKILLGCFWLWPSFLFSSAWLQTAKVDVLYMNHGPLMDTLDRMKGVFSGYGNKISVSWHDFDSKEGADFKAQKGVTRHVPLIIWIDGHEVVKLARKQVKFVGFPTGAGPEFFQGQWTIDDLKAALNQATAKK